MPAGAPDDDRDLSPEYTQAVVDLLGAIAYGEISAFERLAEDSQLAPSLTDKLTMATMASAQLSHVEGLRARIEELDADLLAAMAPFQESIDRFHEHTAPRDWFEGLVKAYVGDQLAADFFREIAELLDPRTRHVIIASLADIGQTDFIIDRVNRAIAADHRLGGRLALWGRRLMGEALIQAQQVAAERDSLTALLTGGADGRPGMDLAEIGRMFTRLTDRHARRMDRLGLES
ncbi:ferritin-like domain-containing protein [Nocardioidaceae bacterium]|nr:ferritin-like domain-containing protein [Nocardioidaceae bacterium]